MFIKHIFSQRNYIVYWIISLKVSQRNSGPCQTPDAEIFAKS